MGRGSSGLGGNIANEMNVEYDSWGKMLEGRDEITLRDKDGNVIGDISDRMVFVSEPDFRTITKKEILGEIDAWRNDDGSYGNEDTSIMLFYDDGTYKSIDVNWSDSTKHYKKSGIIGASVQTADDEWVWGDEGHWKNGKLVRTPIQTFSEDGESGRTNTWAGYKTTGAYKVRIKTTYNNRREDGRYYTKRETIRKSTIKEFNR